MQALKGAEGPIVAVVRLHEDCPGSDRAVAAGPHGDAGHRRFRPQRKPRVPAPALRSRRRIDCRRSAFAARSATESSIAKAAEAIAELGINPEKIDWPSLKAAC